MYLMIVYISLIYFLFMNMKGSYGRILNFKYFSKN